MACVIPLFAYRVFLTNSRVHPLPDITVNQDGLGGNTCINGLKDVKVVLHTFLRKGEALEISTEVTHPPIRGDPCYALANHAASAGAAKKAMTILRNISVIGFCISAMKRGHLEVPEDVAQLAPTDQKIADQTYENLRLLVADSKRTRQVLQLAVCISPLVAFLPMDLVKQSVCPEELLINHRRFGTEKPSKLRSIEDDIWRELFQLSDGVKTPSQVFVSCRQKADAWLKECALDPATCTFYGRESYIPFEPTMSPFNAYVSLLEGSHLSNAARYWVRDEGRALQPSAPYSQPPEIPSGIHVIPTLPLGSPSQTPSTLSQRSDRPSRAPSASTQPPQRPSRASSVRSQSPDSPPHTRTTPAQPPDAPSQPPTSTKADKGKEKCDGVPMRTSLRLKALDKPTQPTPPQPLPPARPGKRKPKRSRNADLLETPNRVQAQRGGSECDSGRNENLAGSPNDIPLVEYETILAISPDDLEEINDNIAHKIEMDEGYIYQYTPKALLTLDTPTQRHWPSSVRSHLLWDGTGGKHVYHPSIHNPADYDTWEDVFSAAQTSQNGCARPFFLDRAEESIIYRCTEAEYSAMTDSAVQDILRRQNIVITGCSDRKVKFNLTGLESLGDLDEPVDIQDQSIELDDTDPDFQQRVCQGTLRLLYDASVAPPEFQKSLNAIGLPMPEAGIRKAAYATDVRAFHRTKSDFACLRFLPGHAMLFGLAATVGAHHWWHVDSRGEATMVYVAVGQKLWVLAEPKDAARLWSTRVWSTEELDVRKLNYDKWHIEMVVLNAGDRLLMRPATPHAVLTTDNAICYGGHFLAASTLQRTVAGSIHTFFRGGVITNTNHPSFQSRMNTIACFFYKAIVLGDTHDLDEGHVPKFTTASGLTDLIVFACGIELQNAICPLSYKSTDDEHLVAMLENCGVSPDDALHRYDFSQSTHEMRVQNVHSRGRVIALLKFVFARIDVIDDRDGARLDPWFDLFIPTLAWFIHAIPTPLDLFWPEYPQVTVSAALPPRDAVSDDSDGDLGIDTPEESDLALQGMRAGDTLYFSCYTYITTPSSTKVSSRRTRSPSLAKGNRKRPRH
ncbi:hypothetical protein BKA70DRAFT_1447519 [Coprinopsis sp. MPI-PUGE-AT-0042]|nr:hypothetical protein BKA70DRAFT_1447519 [Coprinopsis sp. MPI-PUGE-AT-0042]